MTVTPEQILLLCMAAFVAGFVDAIVGGGGLIQTPATLVLLGAYPVVNAIGSTKIPSFSGTVFAVSQYIRKVKVDRLLALVMCVIAFFASFAGSQLLTVVSNAFMKPVLLVVLTAVAIYTYTKKDFGQHEAKDHSTRKELIYGIGISLVLGFYDGFIGPGAGSFLILAFISLLGYDFLRASTHAKLVNLATNLGSIVLFTIKGKIIWAAALPMAASNALGGMLGARMALARGNKFIRIFFLVIIIGTLMRFALDVLYFK
ncbi:MAG TPA: TSUP family transporter [Flavisolibacter sp.]|nr:TSUP family transporter [Flavisolibacter sp.]